MAPIKQCVLPYRSKSTPTVRQCICDKDSCKTLASKFRELGDIRGMYTVVPSISTNTHQKKLATVKAKKSLRIKHYLYPKTSIKPFLTEDKRNRKLGNSNDGVTTRQKKEPKRKQLFFSYCHINPKLLDVSNNVASFNKNDSFILPDTVTKNQLSSLGISISANQKENDQVDGQSDRYLIVPDYKLSSAKRDFEETKVTFDESKQLETIIEQSKKKKVTEQRNGLSQDNVMPESRRDSTSTTWAQKDDEIQKLKEELKSSSIIIKEERAKFDLVLEELQKLKAENEALEKENKLIKEENDVLKARLEQLDNAGVLNRILITIFGK